MRAISTVVDVTVCLLLLTAAVGVLTIPRSDPPAVPVDETAGVLGSSTATIDYALPFEGRIREAAADPRPVRRRAAGTIAALLGQAAVTNVTIAGSHISFGTGEFRRRVRRAARRATSWVADPIRVDAVWTPYRDAPVGGRVAIGPRPPPGVDVRAATLRVPAPVPPVSRPTTAADREALARTVARITIRALFPPRRLRVSLAGIGPERVAIAARYRSAAGALGVSLPELTPDATRAANRRLVAALGDRLATDMRRQFSGVDDAASALRTGFVRVTVRGWPR